MATILTSITMPTIWIIGLLSQRATDAITVQRVCEVMPPQSGLLPVTVTKGETSNLENES